MFRKRRESNAEINLQKRKREMACILIHVYENEGYFRMEAENQQHQQLIDYLFCNSYYPFSWEEIDLYGFPLDLLPRFFRHLRSIGWHYETWYHQESLPYHPAEAFL